VRWQRDHSLDPQLVWKGKDFEADVLEGDAPPIYIQEKIDPRVLIENLRRTSPRPVESRARADAVRHLRRAGGARRSSSSTARRQLVEPHDPGRLAQGHGQPGRARGLRGKVQMVYLDPPYGIKFGSNWQVSARKRDVKDGKVDRRQRARSSRSRRSATRGSWGSTATCPTCGTGSSSPETCSPKAAAASSRSATRTSTSSGSLMDEVFGPENFVSHIVTLKTTSRCRVWLDKLPSPDFITSGIPRISEQVKYRQLFQLKVGGQPWWRGRCTTSVMLPGRSPHRHANEVERSHHLHGAPESFRPATSPAEQGRPNRQQLRVEVEWQEHTRPGKGGWKTNEQGMTAPQC
jgi:adenine-specific DNA-methyltransferase